MLAPGERAHVDLVHRFESPVDSVVRVQLGEDVLPGDNAFRLPMRMKDRRQLLLVAPPDPQSQEQASALALSARGVDLLRYALNPGEALGKGGGTAVQVKRVTPNLLSRVALPIYACVVVYAVDSLPEQSVDDLASFVDNGGGLWLIPGRDNAPRRFNQTFAPLLHGLQITQHIEPEQPQGISRQEADVASPLLRPLIREEWGRLQDLSVRGYFQLHSPGQAKAALRAANRDPLALVARHGRGQVFVQLFGLELEASSLPRSTQFVPYVQRLSGELGEQGQVPTLDSLRVGQTRRVSLPELRGLGGAVQASGTTTKSFPLIGPQQSEIRVSDVTQAGAYRLEHPQKQTGRDRWLTVNPVWGESDPRPLDEATREALLPSRQVVQADLDELETPLSRRSELITPLIVLLLLAFAVEALVGAWQARRQRHPEPAGGER